MRSSYFVGLAFALAALGCEDDNPWGGSVGSFGGANGDGAAGAAGDGAAGAAGGSGAPELELQTYEADDERIQYMGRVDFSDPKAPTYSAPAVTVTVRFMGTGISVLLEDEFKWGTERNFFDAVIDDGEPLKVALEEDQEKLELATELEYGEHTLRFVKRTESSLGKGTFLGVEIMGELLEPPPAPERRLSFIGDSITAGSGADAANNSDECSENAWGEAGGWGQPYHNANASYGAFLARSLEAEYHLEAASGIGLTRNYTSVYDTRPMPEVYGLLFLEDEGDNAPEWDHSLYTPDAIVIGLGTNDFSPGDDDRDPAVDLDVFSAAYIDFIDTLREYHPDAHIFCSNSHMLGDGWPDASDQSRTNLATAIDMVLAHYADEGVETVHEITVAKVDGRGCGTHLNAEQQAEMAEEIRPQLEEVMGW